MDTLIVYSHQSSPRLKYVLDWVLKERLQTGYTIITDRKEIPANTVFISYGELLPNSISIPADGLLSNTGKKKQHLNTGTWNDIPALFTNNEKRYTLNFDLFSAVFFLLSRYEEYYPYTPDKHGRYPAAASILFKQGWLLRPLVDEWVHEFRQVIQKAAGQRLVPASFIYQPTYDIDMAYAYLHRGAARILGAYAHAFIKMDISQISQRIQVFKNKQKDPYDSFRWLRQLHKQYEHRPLYFILSADKTSAFDKNIHPRHPSMMRVIKNLGKEGQLGIHPSYYSDQKNTLDKEKKMLENAAGCKINISRQHYIKIKIPDTCRLLLRHNITDDYSMGYGSSLGFRAGTGSSFLWYDLENEVTTGLRIHPFCFMDTTAHYQLNLSPAEAFAKLEEMTTRLMQTGSTLITVFHNFSLGTDIQWKGWKAAYEHFLQERFKLEEVKEYNL